MGNPFYNRFNNMMNHNQYNNIFGLINQAKQLEKNPGQILDILIQNGKIDQQQYNELQEYKSNPQQIFNYLINHGNAMQLNQAQQKAGPYRNQL